jgi:hypothetical protein
MKRPTSSKRRYRDFDAVDARDQPLQEQLPPLNGVNDETTALGLDQGDADQVPQQLLLSRVDTRSSAVWGRRAHADGHRGRIEQPNSVV